MNKFVYVVVLIALSLLMLSCTKNGTEPNGEPLELNFTVTHVSVYGESDGDIDLTVSGGERPYQFQWSNGSEAEDIGGLSAGVYSVIVTDASSEMITDSVTITQPNETGTVTDIDGNIYQTVRIGEQWWIAENLKVIRDPQGNPITSFYPDNDVQNLDVYGRLYTWHVAMDSAVAEGSRGIAPEGWHIPTLEEWNTLVNTLGGEDVAAAQLKEQGTAHWTSNEGATNSSGFTAVPAGGSYQGTAFDGFGFAVHYWTSTHSGDRAHIPSIMDNDVYTLFEEKIVTASIRCIKD